MPCQEPSNSRAKKARMIWKKNSVLEPYDVKTACVSLQIIFIQYKQK